jgi:hypothetical protein
LQRGIDDGRVRQSLGLVEIARLVLHCRRGGPRSSIRSGGSRGSTAELRKGGRG